PASISAPIIVVVPVCASSFSLIIPRPTQPSTLFPYTTLFRSSFIDDQIVHWPQASFSRMSSTSKVLTSFLLETSPVSALLFSFRSEEHTSEVQSRDNLVCRLLLEKKTADVNTCHQQKCLVS